MWCSEDRGWVAKRRRRSALPLSLYLALLLGSVGFARSATLLVPEDYATIQAAVDASVPGDTVLLRQGLYRGPGNRGIDFRGKDIVLKSISGPEWTVLDCENADRGFYFHEGESRAARVEGIGIWNGQVGAAGVGWGGGLHIQGSDPTISDCIIQYCEADDGGGVYVLSNGSRIERCVIRANIADGAGGGIVVPWGAAEIVDCEIRLEEDLYVAGLEWADAQGADVVSTSIGYREFLEEGAAYRREDLDGRTAVTSIAAAWLARRGVILVTAVGNEGWSASSLITPADADSIIAVGAVDSLGRVAAFSSRGPTADGRIKPDLCARGVATACAAWPGEDRYTLANGTSLATPLMAGLAALLRQAHPEWGPARVIEALRHAADQREAPDNARGWGVPDGLRAVDSHLGISPELRDPAWTDLQPWIEGAALDHEASPGDSGTVSFWVTNEGSVPTPELRVSLVAQAEILEPGAASANLAPIEPGVMARAVALPARIGARAEPGDSLMALVRFEGADGSFWVRRLRLAITPAQLAVRIFPNPARLGSSLFLDLDAAGPAPWRIDLYDCAGRAVVRWRSEQTGRSGEGGTSAPLRLQMPLPSRLAAGTYFVLATDGSAARRSRVVLLP